MIRLHLPPRLLHPSLFTSALLTTLAALALSSPARAAIDIDATQPPPPVQPLPFPVDGKSPSGQVLGVNSRYFTLNDKPFFPVMGEMHFSRYPADEWEAEILKMKASGINTVAAYVFWIHHEETQGKFDWAGQRDLHKFVALCAKHGLYFWLRIGPWDHGEARNGGFPDWVQALGQTRTNSPAYLAAVETFFNQIGAQVKGQFWKDGGPIIGVQIENEFKGAAAHSTRLLELARAAGMDAPFYTQTGWDRAVIPTTGFLPVFGGYTEQFWSNSLGELPPNVNFFFTPLRAEDNVNANLQSQYPYYNGKYDNFPFLTAEMGGGMAIAYHRRPIMYADDSAAAAMVKLGAGITALGYYMYHGGTNPDGLTSLQETQSQPDGKGYNDMEVKAYDFQAPLGEFGQFHPALRPVKTLGLFLNDFGSLIAPMVTYYPAQMPQTTRDVSTPRVVARFNGEQGFIFINNYQRLHPLDEHKDFQVSLKLPSGAVQIPRQPTTIPTGEYAIWPVNFDLGGVTLQYATAQLLCKIDAPNTFVFFAWPGTPAEFSFTLAPGDTIGSTSGNAVKDGTRTTISGIRPGNQATITVNHAGKAIQLLVLTRDQALNLWKANLAGRDRLVLSPAGVYFDNNDVHLSSRNPADLRAGFFPTAVVANAGSTDAPKDGLFTQYVMPASADKIAVTLAQTKPAAPSQPAKMSRRNVAMEPEDADFARAGVWSVKVPASVLSGTNRPFLVINYEGDVARLYAGPRFANDNFYKGAPYEIGLWRFTPQELQNGLDLKILPLRSDTRLYLPADGKPAFDDKGEALKIKSIDLVWDYQAVMQIAP